jgi:hypothetical protein
MSFGVGYLWDSGTTQKSDDYAVRGAFVPISIALGGSPIKGFVVGGTAGIAYLAQPMFTLNGETPAAENSRKSGDGLGYDVGAFVDIYPNPAKGLHFQGAISFAYLDKPKLYGNESSDNAGGVAFAGGVGYDFWLGPQWSVGLLGKLTYGSLRTSRDDFGVNNQTVVAPALLASFVYH